MNKSETLFSHPVFPEMKFLGNITWFLCGGVLIALEYLIASILLMVTIVGIPFGLQTLKMAGLAAWPFGKEVRVTHKGSGLLPTIMNLIWILVCGFWIALTHLFFGLIFTLTIIGIPYGEQHFKLAALSLTPFGREIVQK